MEIGPDPGSILHEFHVLDFLQGDLKVEIESIRIVANIGADFEDARGLQDMLKGFNIRPRCAEGCLAQDVDVNEVGAVVRVDISREDGIEPVRESSTPSRSGYRDGGSTMRLLKLSRSSRMPLLESMKLVITAIVQRIWYC